MNNFEVLIAFYFLWHHVRFVACDPTGMFLRIEDQESVSVQKSTVGTMCDLDFCRHIIKQITYTNISIRPVIFDSRIKHVSLTFGLAWLSPNIHSASRHSSWRTWQYKVCVYRWAGDWQHRERSIVTHISKIKSHYHSRVCIQDRVVHSKEKGWAKFSTAPAYKQQRLTWSKKMRICIRGLSY